MVVADGDEGSFGEVAQHLAVLGHHGYVEVMETAAHEARAGGLAVVGVELVDLVHLQQLDKPVEQAGMAAEKRHHLADILGIEHGRFTGCILGVVLYIV